MEPLGRGPGTASCEPLPSWCTSSKSTFCCRKGRGENLHQVRKQRHWSRVRSPLICHLAGLEQVTYPFSVQLSSINWNQWFSLCAPSLARIFSYTQVNAFITAIQKLEIILLLKSDFSFLLSCQYLLIAFKKEKIKQIKDPVSCTSILLSFTSLCQNLRLSTTLNGQHISSLILLLNLAQKCLICPVPQQTYWQHHPLHVLPSSGMATAHQGTVLSRFSLLHCSSSSPEWKNSRQEARGSLRNVS